MDGVGSDTIAPLGHGDPARLGSWELVGRLGAGGMGVVYLGRSAGRMAAVKAVVPGLAASSEFRARFRREVAICRRVTGPQIAELYDADTDGPQPWLAVRYVPGPTLDQAITRHGPMTESTARGFALAVLEALRAIHRERVIHRDLKPANVILTPDTPVIIDFGIAGAADTTTLTATGTMVGSAGWMAPEQILGHGATEAADVFAWGALVAYATTGRPPFGVGRPEALTYRIVHGTADLDGIPDSLGPLVARALATEPAERPTVDELLDQLTTDSSGSGVAAAIGDDWVGEEAAVLARTQVRPAGTPLPRAARRPRRGRRAMAVAAAAVAVAGGVLAWALTRPDAATDSSSSTTAPPQSSTSAAASTTASTSTSTTTTTTTTTEPTTTTLPRARNDLETAKDHVRRTNWEPDQDVGFDDPYGLAAISAYPTGCLDTCPYTVYFFHGGEFRNFDDTTYSTEVNLVGDDDPNSVTVSYGIFSAAYTGELGEQPTGPRPDPATVRFTWDPTSRRAVRDPGTLWPPVYDPTDPNSQGR